jgi:anti-sigma B factor antagonist
VTAVSDASVSGSASGAHGADPFGAGLPLDTAVSRPQPGTVLLQVDGEIDTLTAPRMQAGMNTALDALAATPAGAALVVDLSGVTFLASSGLAVLVDGARRATAAGRRLHVVAATRVVTRPLELTGADTLFATYADLPSALAAVGPATVAPPPGE